MDSVQWAVFAWSRYTTLEGLLRSMTLVWFSRTFINFDSLNPETFTLFFVGSFMLLSASSVILVVNSTSSFAAGMFGTVALFACAGSGSALVVMRPASSLSLLYHFLSSSGLM